MEEKDRSGALTIGCSDRLLAKTWQCWTARNAGLFSMRQTCPFGQSAKTRRFVPKESPDSTNIRVDGVLSAWLIVLER
jgi:hypothetical protein